jgi:glycerol-3-phosphate dehydrogenase
MEANRCLRKDKTVSTSDVRAAWSGIRPLVTDPSKKHGDTKSVSRSHVVEVSDIGKLVTIAGGKWTTYRRYVFPKREPNRLIYQTCFEI